MDLREQWKSSLFLQSIFCLPCWMCENVSRVLVVYSQDAWKSIYHAQQHPNVLNCACFVHQIFKKRICYSFKFVSFHQSLKNELRMLHIHLASFLSSWHHCLKNETIKLLHNYPTCFVSSWLKERDILHTLFFKNLGNITLFWAA